VAKAFSQRKLDGLRREWQKLLRLQDWRIVSKFVNPEILKERTQEEKAVGACGAFAETKEAEIIILGPQYWSEEYDARERDVEDTIVHELLHCHFAPFEGKNDAVALQHEQAIEAITEALLVLKRKKGNK
jgi:hypothetical protein